MVPARMRNPADVLPEAVKPLQSLYMTIQGSGVPAKTLGLVHLRASQINGCAMCLDTGVRHAKQAGETDERLHAVAARGASAALLRVAVGTPLLAVDRVAFTYGDRPVEVRRGLCTTRHEHYWNALT